MRPDTNLERLGIPVLDLLNAWHMAEVMRELIELLYAVGKPDRQLLCSPARTREPSATRVTTGKRLGADQRGTGWP